MFRFCELGTRGKGDHGQGARLQLDPDEHGDRRAVPASNPQKPPAAVILFHSIPRITVPNSGAIKKAEQRLNVIHDASELRHHWKG